jgi:hypothetical protein
MIAATFHGLNHYIPNHDESSIEVFENIGHAISALFDRYESHGERNLEARYLNGGKWRRAFHAELGDSFECYLIDAPLGTNQGGHISDDTVLDALTAVHAGLWSYKLRLMRPFNFPGDTPDSKVAVAVEKRV